MLEDYKGGHYHESLLILSSNCYQMRFCDITHRVKTTGNAHEEAVWIIGEQGKNSIPRLETWNLKPMGVWEKSWRWEDTVHHWDFVHTELSLELSPQGPYFPVFSFSVTSLFLMFLNTCLCSQFWCLYLQLKPLTEFQNLMPSFLPDSSA